jgi:hypothetical protein
MVLIKLKLRRIHSHQGCVLTLGHWRFAKKVVVHQRDFVLLFPRTAPRFLFRTAHHQATGRDFDQLGADRAGELRWQRVVVKRSRCR